jgi:Sec-independent protein translocase protein TatA
MASRKPLVVSIISDVAGAILGTKKLGEAVSGVGSTSEDAQKQAERAMRSLGVQSESVADSKIAKLREQFDNVKNSGVASADEIARAQATMEKKIERINSSIGRDTKKTWDSILDRVKSGIGRINISASDALRFGARGALVGAGLAAGAGAAAFAGIKGSAGVADDLTKLARTTSTSVEALSAYSFAAEQSGVDTAALAVGFKGLLNAVEKGRLEDFGIGTLDAAGKTRKFDEILRDTVEKLSNMSDEGKRAAKASEIFGAKAGPQMASFIALGAAGLDEYTDKARKWGLVISQDSGEAAERFNDRLDDITQRLKGIRQEASAPFFDAFAQSFDKIGSFIDRNRDKLVDFAGVISGQVLAVVEDLIAILEGRNGDVQNKWIIELVEGMKTFAGVMSSTVIPVAEGLFKIFQGIALIADGLGWVIEKIGNGAGHVFSALAFADDTMNAERNARAYAQTSEFKAIVSGNPVNINIGGESYPMTAETDVISAIQQDQNLKTTTRPTGQSRAYG